MKKADLVAWREMLITSRDHIAKPSADFPAKRVPNSQRAQNWIRMIYNSFKRVQQRRDGQNSRWRT